MEKENISDETPKYESLSELCQDLLSRIEALELRASSAESQNASLQSQIALLSAQMGGQG